MGYQWDQLMSELGPTALALSALSLLTLWVLSRRRQPQEALEAGQAQQSRASDEEALSQVRERLSGAGLAVIEGLTLLDKSGERPQERRLDFVTVFGEGLWLLRVYASPSDAEEELERAELERVSHEDLQLLKVVERVAQSKRLSEVTLRYGLVTTGATIKLPSSPPQLRVMNLYQLSKRTRRAAKENAAAPAVDLEGARQLWRHLKQLDRSAPAASEADS